MGSKVDKSDLAAVLTMFPDQIREAGQLGGEITVPAPKAVAIAGMGGSGLPGPIVQAVVDLVPVISVREYALPAFIDEQALVVAVSYSGNTEETLAAYAEAKRRGAQTVAIASGGKLLQQAEEDSVPFIRVPAGLQPRMALGYQTVPILSLLTRCGLAEDVDWDSVARFLKRGLADVKGSAQQLAPLLAPAVPLIYASTRFGIAAYKWKIDLNENAKMHAFSNVFPESNHNELNGFAKPNGEYVVVMLRDAEDHPRIIRRFEAVKRLLAKKGIKVIDIASRGPDFMTRLFWTIWLGDWVSYFVALQRGVDPTPVEMVEELKKALQERS